MTARVKIPSVKAPLVIALAVLVMLVATGPVGAFYAPAGAKPTGVPGGYMNPNDGMCIVGVAADGTMLVDWSITNARDCVAYTTGLTGMTPVDVTAQNVCGAAVPPTGACNTQPLCTRPNGSVVWNAAASKCFDVSSCVSAGASNASCTAAGVPSRCCTGLGTGTCGLSNDGYKHTFATTNTCVDAADPTTAISLLDLDRTAAMCTSKGGTTLSPIPGTCVAYGWVYRNRKSDGPPPTLPVSGTGISTTDGVQASDGLGFCYTAIRMTGGTYTSATCPSIHNAPATAPAGEWPACASSTTGCQTQASYDAGLGWSFSSPNCVYGFGLQGTSNAAVTSAAGVTTPAGSLVNPSQYTNQGDCLANGFSWDNWLPSAGTTTKTNADGGDYAGMPAGAMIRKLNALEHDEEGPGDFYSGTGWNCLRCHSDQSRAYQERNKPGLVKSRHLKAGDNPAKPFAGYFMAGSSSWGLQGVQCGMCHSTGRPAQDDLIQVNPAGAPNVGNPKSATGHNQTEYGAHLLDICYTCHGSPANPPTTNPASVIPVSGGDFALTNNTPGPPTSNLGNANCTAAGVPSACCTGLGTGTCTAPPNVGGLAPIVNQFLNSPHGQYNGDSLKVNIGNKNNYGSTFEGYVCRSANGVGQGSIITTVYRNGKAEKIPNLDSATNPACTNPGDGSSTSGAGGFWVKDGETSPGVPTDTAQGNCMTCHDVHWALADTDPEAEPFRRECTTCHVDPDDNPGSASGAPQIDLSTINHSKTAGTPLENWLTHPDEACEICHMPKSGGSNSSPMHLWRINPDPSYQTMGATHANLAPDVEEGYDDAAWVDIPHACGQCHGTDGVTAPKPGAPPFTTEQLAQVAEGMHASAGISYPVTFGIAVSGPQVTVTAAVECGGTCPTFAYNWDWGDGSLHGTANPDNHTYASGGSKSITLTVLLNGKNAGSATRSFTISNPNPPLTFLPDPNATCTAAGAPLECCTGVGTGTCPNPCTWHPETWTMDVAAAASGGNSPLQIVMRWGDSSDPKIIRGASAFVHHTYLTINDAPYTVTMRAIDARLQSVVATCPVEATPARFQITGTVLAEGANTPVRNALVRLRKGTTIVKYVYTPADGTFALKNVRPGSYTLRVVRAGFTFPPTPITVGPDSVNNVITGAPQ